MTYLVVAAAGTVALLLGYAFEEIWKRTGGLPMQGLLFGVALAPTFISLCTYVSFATISYAMPNRWLYILFPVIASLLIALITWSRVVPSRHPDNELKSSSIGMLRWMGLIPFLPIILIVIANASSPQVDHDLSIYLLEGLSLQAIMVGGADHWLEWTNVAHPVVSHPHGLSYSLMLAWGFLFEPAPGPGFDTAPKLLVGFTHFCLLFASAGLLVERKTLVWAWVAACLVVTDFVLAYEVEAFSRDSFYVTPTIVMLGILLQRGGTNSGPVAQSALLPFAALALWGALTGHSLGVVFMASVFTVSVSLELVRSKRAIFRSPLLWLTFLSLTAISVYHAIAFFSERALETMGFAFPFYSDPFLREAFERNQAFLSDVNQLSMLRSILNHHRIHAGWLLIPTFAGVLILYETRRRRINEHDASRFITLLATIIVVFLMVIATPFRINGASLAGAFESNPRYSLFVGVVFFVLVGESFRLILNFIGSRYSTTALLPAAAILLGIYATEMASRYDRIDNNLEAKMAMDRDRICATLQAAGARRVYVDDDAFIYYCPDRVSYLFTSEGAELLKPQVSDAIQTALDEKQVDALVFFRSIGTWWEGAALYRFVSANWNVVPSDSGKVFRRPGDGHGEGAPLTD